MRTLAGLGLEEPRLENNTSSKSSSSISSTPSNSAHKHSTPEPKSLCHKSPSSLLLRRCTSPVLNIAASTDWPVRPPSVGNPSIFRRQSASSIRHGGKGPRDYLGKAKDRVYCDVHTEALARVSGVSHLGLSQAVGMHACMELCNLLFENSTSLALRR